MAPDRAPFVTKLFSLSPVVVTQGKVGDFKTSKQYFWTFRFVTYSVSTFPVFILLLKEESKRQISKVSVPTPTPSVIPWKRPFPKEAHACSIPSPLCTARQDTQARRPTCQPLPTSPCSTAYQPPLNLPCTDTQTHTHTLARAHTRVHAHAPTTAHLRLCALHLCCSSFHPEVLHAPSCR